MKNFHWKNIDQPTPAFWSKVGVGCISVSTFVAGTAIATNNPPIAYFSLGVGTLGTLLTTFFKQ